MLCASDSAHWIRPRFRQATQRSPISSDVSTRGRTSAAARRNTSGLQGMAETVVVDSGFLVAFFRHRNSHHAWAAEQARRHSPPWHICEAVLSEAFFILRSDGVEVLSDLIRRGSLITSFRVAEDIEAIFDLMRKYADVPMAFAEACLVRMGAASERACAYDGQRLSDLPAAEQTHCSVLAAVGRWSARRSWGQVTRRDGAR